MRDTLRQKSLVCEKNGNGNLNPRKQKHLPCKRKEGVHSLTQNTPFTEVRSLGICRSKYVFKSLYKVGLDVGEVF